jgi:hypothetical protein
MAVLAGLLSSLVLGTLVLGSLVLGAPSAWAATLSPTVLSASATPGALGPAGGQVLVSGTVNDAVTCQLVLLSRQSFPVVYSHNATTECQDGNFSAHVTIGANPSSVKRTVAFALIARNGTSAFSGRFYVVLEPLLVPSVLSARATPGALGPAGGQVLASGTVRNAKTCQLVLLSRQSFPVVYSHNPATACQGGNFSAHVTIGANPTATKRSVAFALIARNGTYSSTGRFYVVLEPLLVPSVLTARATPSALGPAGVQGATGYDISWPQCTSRTSAQTKLLPAPPPYAIVGVNNGTIGTLNSCFAAEVAWAGKDLSVYLILQPAPGGKPVPFEATGPEAACASTSSECEGYDWGYNYAETDIAFVKAQGADPKVWWLDVETAEGWPTSASLQPVNAAIIQGALAAIKHAGGVGGIYCTWYQWGEITGSYVPPGGQTPLWVAGALSLNNGYYSAQSYCQRALSAGDPSTLKSGPIGFAGGVPWLVQDGYSSGSPTRIDADYSCG